MAAVTFFCWNGCFCDEIRGVSYAVLLFSFLQNWASSSSPVGRITYQTYDQKDFDKLFNATTPYSKAFFLGIGKPNMSKNAAPESKIWDTSASVDFNKGKLLTFEVLLLIIQL